MSIMFTTKTSTLFYHNTIVVLLKMQFYKVLYLQKGMSFLLCGSAKAKIEEGATPIKGLGGEKIST